jgi:hypothetical protein
LIINNFVILSIAKNLVKLTGSRMKGGGLVSV